MIKRFRAFIFSFFVLFSSLSSSIYLIHNTVDISSGLTIEAGTIIKFKAEAGIRVMENGFIKAIGLVDNIILFTSVKDDTGGDTNDDLAETTPNAGDWNLIDLLGQEGSQFNYCKFMYGGDDVYCGVLSLGENYSEVEYCLFANNSTYVNEPIYFGALSAQDTDITTIIKHNIITQGKAESIPDFKIIILNHIGHFSFFPSWTV